MNKKNLSLLIAIAVMLIANIIQIVLRPSPPAVLCEWKPETVDRILITNSDGEIEFVRNGSEWRVGPEKYLADGFQMTGLVRRLEKSRLLEKVTESENYSRYGLDEESTGKISIFSGGENLQTIYIGQENATGILSYIRLPDEKGVYLVSRNLREQIEMTVDDYREKEMAELDSDKIKTIKVTKGDIYTLVKSVNTKDNDSGNEEVWTLASDSSFDLDQQAVTRLANAFTTVSAYEFIDNIEGEPIWEVEVTLDDGDSVSFEIYAPDENDHYPAAATSSEYEFLLGSYKAAAIMKTLQDLMPAAE